ncbi:MAG: hypothetical protein J6Y77_07990 [Paludibacteraceae bacterium]|nr:hypothetical protein [Paludibacteraceae bacterium]
MSTGKEVCKNLRRVRREIAKANGIVLIQKNCTHKDGCQGTCPRCEQEVRYLSAELEKRRRMGMAVKIVGVAALSGTVALSSCVTGGEPLPPTMGVPVSEQDLIYDEFNCLQGKAYWLLFVEDGVTQYFNLRWNVFYDDYRFLEDDKTKPVFLGEDDFAVYSGNPSFFGTAAPIDGNIAGPLCLGSSSSCTANDFYLDLSEEAVVHFAFRPERVDYGFIVEVYRDGSTCSFGFGTCPPDYNGLISVSPLRQFENGWIEVEISASDLELDGEGWQFNGISFWNCGDGAVDVDAVFLYEADR